MTALDGCFNTAKKAMTALDGILYGIQHPLVAMGVHYSLRGGGVRYSLVNNVCRGRSSLGYKIHSDTGHMPEQLLLVP